MIVLDENIVAAQRRLLLRWRIRFHRIGGELGRAGMKDDEILPLLHRIGNVTFFTGDDDFFDPRLRQPKCCFAWLDVEPDEMARFIRRLLKHPRFNTRRLRLGNVLRVSHVGLFTWMPKATAIEFIAWD